MVLEFVPLALATLLVLLLLIDAASPAVHTRVSRIALAVFGRKYNRRDPRRRELYAAHISTPFRLYVARTRLYVVTIAAITAVLGIYVAVGVLTFVDVRSVLGGREFGFTLFGLTLDVLNIENNTPLETALVIAATSALLALLGAVATYGIRRYIPRARAEARAKRIDAGLPQTIAFIYALSRGGMETSDALETLSRNQAVYGEAADEVNIAVRNMNLFGRDVVSGLRLLAERSPSNTFRVFSENLSSVLQSGGDISAFLRNQYERYRERAKERRDELIETLATVAEVYVTVAVAGMLFLITILLIIGLTSGDTLFFIQMSTYLVLPAINAIFIAYLAESTATLRAQRDDALTDEDLQALRSQSTLPMPLPTQRDGRERSGEAAADGGVRRPATGLGRADYERFLIYERLRALLAFLRQPIEGLLQRPTRLLYATVPIAAVYVAIETVPALLDGTVEVRAIDDPIIIATIFVLGTFGVVHQIHRRRLNRLEESVPEVLDRLASLNEAGVTVVNSFDRLRESDLGRMNEEIERIWRDIQWGATVSEALVGFENRVRTPVVTRLVTLMNNALEASNQVGKVLRIAGEQTRAERRFKRARQQEMTTYLVAIYISFLVFLVVIMTIDLFFIPQLSEAAAEAAETGQAQQFLSISLEKLDTYQLTFFHAAVLQSVLSGLVGGQMSNGSVKDGAKHAAIMLVITYLTFEALQTLG